MDTKKIHEVALFICNMIVMPIQFVLAVYFIASEVGVCIFGGFGVVFVIFGINSYIMRIYKECNESLMKVRD